MQKQIDAATGKPGEDILFSFASDTEAFHGRLTKARELSQRAISSARRNDSPETAAAWQMNSALREAEFGNTERSRRELASALVTASTRDVNILAASALARIGDTDRANRIADDLAKQFPLNTTLNRYWLPAIYASIEIKRGNPAKAIRSPPTCGNLRTRHAPTAVWGWRVTLSPVCARRSLSVSRAW